MIANDGRLGRSPLGAVGAIRDLTIGIRREDKNRWERRAPLTPDHVDTLLKTCPDLRVLVEPSTRRVFDDAAYTAVGAELVPDLRAADAVLGVKEVPAAQLLRNKTYCFFSHTRKGQPYNMPLLRAVLDKQVRLVDYELMTDAESGKRLVQFSGFAGSAGFVDGLHALGQRLLALGYATPFLHVPMSYVHYSRADARARLHRVGHDIAQHGFPAALGPVVIGFTGAGAVARGALAMTEDLPVTWVRKDELARLHTQYDRRRLYAIQVLKEDHLVNGHGAYDAAEYAAHPQRYRSTFAAEIAPYLRMMVNGIYWSEPQPRLLTNADLPRISGQLLTIADISADMGGSIQFVTAATDLDQPAYMARLDKNGNDLGDPHATQCMVVDNLPTEFPREASEHFGNALLPHLQRWIRGDDDPQHVFARATIAADGRLAPDHVGLEAALAQYAAPRRPPAANRVLVLGSGFVAGPLVRYLQQIGVALTIASNQVSEAEALVAELPCSDGVTVMPLDLGDAASTANAGSLDTLLAQYDAVVSLVPATMHLAVAESAIRARVPMVTASYISPAMQALDSAAVAAGVPILNEVGLDPGIDHLTACAMFDQIRREGGTLTEFISWCGGLPAPEDADNPLGYKFSWSPRGVLLAALNPATYRMDGADAHVASILDAVQAPLRIRGFALEGLANRDSTQYIARYGLPPDIATCFRGTLRYPGFAELMRVFKRVGLLDTEKRVVASTWADLMDLSASPSHAQPQLERRGIDPVSAARAIACLQQLGMLPASEDAAAAPHRPQQGVSHLDAFCARLQQQLVYAPGERDLVVMQHQFGLTLPTHRERRTSTLVVYGDPEGDSAMAKTVGLPAAIATELVLRGGVSPGVHAPMAPSIYEPMLAKLVAAGIVFKEQVQRL
ncbi:hypothetical protein CXG81DRAFT_30296 [Caulochytrium protostelioides]|uniref:Uncharacterized protein n=1 Tax=Caulochytrium protostelioides TaxID=1555241 RepID=A0A4P9X057_9FUNG|nr:hypothetical protein CXG81DRAFT_30296 [Caulochytrium protostelioides]|eukprot:RKO99111.1 hypothetical protein CXG81DRAFT_30296 [Caulochytrium protostelioides]